MKTANLPRALVALSACVILSGCVHNAPIDVTQSGRESVIPAGFVAPEIRPTVKLAMLEDVVPQMGNTYSVNSGKVFRSVFTGSESAPASLDVIESSMTQNTAAGALYLTSNLTVTYSVRAVLNVNGQKHNLSATASASTSWTLDRAAREAVERVVVDLAKQANALMAAG